MREGGRREDIFRILQDSLVLGVTHVSCARSFWIQTKHGVVGGSCRYLSVYW